MYSNSLRRLTSSATRGLPHGCLASSCCRSVLSTSSSASNSARPKCRASSHMFCQAFRVVKHSSASPNSVLRNSEPSTQTLAALHATDPYAQQQIAASSLHPCTNRRSVIPTCISLQRQQARIPSTGRAAKAMRGLGSRLVGQGSEHLRWRSAQVSASDVRILLSSSGTFSKNLRRGRFRLSCL